MQLVPWASWSFLPGHPPGAVISPTVAFFASVRAVGMAQMALLQKLDGKNTRIYIIQSLFLGNESRNI